MPEERAPQLHTFGSLQTRAVGLFTLLKPNETYSNILRCDIRVVHDITMHKVSMKQSKTQPYLVSMASGW